VHDAQLLLQDFIGCFAFSLKELDQIKGQEVWIVLEDDNPIFRWPYKLNGVERTLVQTWTSQLLNATLVEPFKGEYALTIVTPAKKHIFL
jgi:hypothetical protein